RRGKRRGQSEFTNPCRVKSDSPPCFSAAGRRGAAAGRRRRRAASVRVGPDLEEQGRGPCDVYSFPCGETGVPTWLCRVGLRMAFGVINDLIMSKVDCHFCLSDGTMSYWTLTFLRNHTEPRCGLSCRRLQVSDPRWV